MMNIRQKRKMKKISLIFLFLILSIPAIYANVIEDSISQQIGINSENTNEMTIEEALAQQEKLDKIINKLIIVIIFLAILFIIDIILKGLAMWRASKNNSKIWFWCLLIINTFGILPLIYLLISKEDIKKKANNKKLKKDL